MKVTSSATLVENYVEIEYLASRGGLFYRVQVFGMGFEAGKLKLQANQNSTVACPGIVEVTGQDVKWSNSTGNNLQSCRSLEPGLVLGLCG